MTARPLVLPRVFQALACVLFALCATSCSKELDPREEAAVQSVMDQWLKVKYPMLESMGQGGDGAEAVASEWKKSPVERHVAYVVGLKAIDVSRCASSFQRDWDRFVDGVTDFTPPEEPDYEDLDSLMDHQQKQAPLAKLEAEIMTSFEDHNRDIAKMNAEQAEFDAARKKR